MRVIKVETLGSYDGWETPGLQISVWEGDVEIDHINVDCSRADEDAVADLLRRTLPNG